MSENRSQQSGAANKTESAFAENHGRHISVIEWVLAGVVVLTVWLVFVPHEKVHFTNWDDDRFIFQNPLFLGDTWKYAVAAVTQVQFEAYQPLHLLSYLPDKLFWPDSPLGYRLLNIGIFSVSVVGIFFLLRRRVSPIPAFLSCLIFALHPLRVESVAWISARKDLLSILFVIATLFAIDRANDCRNRQVSAFAFEFAAIGLFMLAMLTKSSVLPLAGLVFAWRRWVHQNTLSDALKRTAIYGIAGALFAALVYQFWSENQMIAPERPVPILADVFGTLGFYLEKLFLPIELAPIYPPVPAHYKQLAIGAGLGVAGVLFFWKQLPPMFRFTTVVLIGSLVPFLNVVRLYYGFADRYFLLAALGLCIPIGRLLDAARSLKPRGALHGTGLAVVMILGLLSVRQSSIWASSNKLWSSAVEKQPGAMFNHSKLASTCQANGAHEAAALSYLGATEGEPRSIIPLVGLFASLVDNAASKGVVDRAVAKTWVENAKKLSSSRPDLQRLINEIDKGGCTRCAQALLWIALEIFPQSPQELTSLARQSVNKGNREVAWIYLVVLRDRELASQQAKELSLPLTAREALGLPVVSNQRCE